METDVPVHWNGKTGENVVWKVPVPGVGHASPIVWEDTIFVATCLVQDTQRVLLCLDRETGEILWKQVVITAPLERKNLLNSYASGTPATDGEVVYVTFLEPDGTDVPDRRQPRQYRSPGNMLVAAYDFDGNQKWAARPGRFASIHGYCSSPVLFKDTVIVNGDHDGDAYIVAVNELGENCCASAAISGGQIVLRGDEHLFCLGDDP